MRRAGDVGARARRVSARRLVVVLVVGPAGGSASPGQLGRGQEHRVRRHAQVDVLRDGLLRGRALVARRGADGHGLVVEVHGAAESEPRSARSPGQARGGQGDALVGSTKVIAVRVRVGDGLLLGGRFLDGGRLGRGLLDNGRLGLRLRSICARRERRRRGTVSIVSSRQGPSVWERAPTHPTPRRCQGRRPPSS